MKVVERDKKPEEKVTKYPCLKVLISEHIDVCKKLIVLFNKPSCGTVLVCDSGTYKIGEYCEDDWNEGNFEKYNGEIHLSND